MKQFNNTSSTLIYLLSYLWVYRVRAGFALVFLIAAKVALIYVPLLLKPIYDQLDGTQNSQIIVPVMLIITVGLLRFGGTLFNELRDILFTSAVLPSVRNIGRSVFSHLLNLPLSYHLQRQTGALSRDIERGTKAINSLLYVLVLNILPSIFELTVVCIILSLRYPFKFCAVLLIGIFSYGVFTYYVSTWRMKYRREANETDSSANSVAIDALINYETVKYFNNEHHEAERYDEHLLNWQHAFYKSESSLGLLNLGQALIIGIATAVMLLMAAQEVAADRMTIGDFALVNSFLIQVFMPLNALGYVFRNIQTSLIDIERMFSLLNQESENHDESLAPITLSKADIAFNHVNFHYQPERQILNDINMEIKGGSKVALVGASGSGKSTIARLLYGFYQATDGEILIDGQDISNVNLDSLRRHIGIVPQDMVLFNNTIEFNIRYGQPECSDEALAKVIKMAHLDNFIDTLSDGLSTMVGERGLKLSGGEKQRIAIARTLLKDPPILILDEATSALDSKSEEAIQNALQEVTKNRTTLIIAHRLSTIKEVDHIYVFDQGQLIESGDHQTLIETDTQYRQLWQLQQTQKSADYL